MIATSASSGEYLAAANRMVSSTNGVDYAYRQVGEGTSPLVLLQHFRGNLDNWDPALVDALARDRRVVTFDNAGVGGSTGTTPSTITQMAHDAIAFLEALQLDAVDLLGFSIGSFVAQEIALIRPAAVRRLVLASAAPRGAAGIHGWAPEVIGAVGAPEPNPDGYLDVFFARSAESRQAGVETPGAADRTARRSGQADDLADPAGSIRRRVRLGASRITASCRRVSAIGMPVFVANGDGDPMILPHLSYLLAGLIPQARVKMYPDAAHGFLFQHHAEFAGDVDAFLRE